MKQHPKHLWFKPKGYTHLSKKIDNKDIGFVASYMADPKNIISHKFHPLIHRTIVTKKLKPTKDRVGNTVKKHWKIDPETGKRKSNAKFREIYYANHIDAHIYSYYTNKILTPLYEKQILQDINFSDCICAYRKIPVPGKKRKKCNVDFAADVFRELKNRKVESVALTFDIKSFFDSLNHKILKQAWCRLLSETEKTLPKDHFKIFREITRFTFVEFDDLRKEFGIKHPNDIIEKNIPKFTLKNSDIKDRIIKKGLLKQNAFRDQDKNMKGIPQGTPISAFLANLYLLEFDKSVYEKVVLQMGGMYKRYSDDIIVIVNKNDEQVVEKFIVDEIKKYRVEIQTTKTKKAYFDCFGRLEAGSKPLQYLGFECDGDRVLLKSASLSKFFRNMKKNVRYKAFLAMQQRRRAKPEKQIFTSNIYKSFSHYGLRTRNPLKRNYFSYAYYASKIMNEPRIKKQLSKSWEVLNERIKFYSKRYKLKILK